MTNPPDPSTPDPNAVPPTTVPQPASTTPDPQAASAASAQPVSPISTTGPPSPGPTRNPLPFILAAVLVGFLVFIGFIWWGNSTSKAPRALPVATSSSSTTTKPAPTASQAGAVPTASPTNTSDTATSTASSTATSTPAIPAVTGLNPDCKDAHPVLPKHWLGQSLKADATSGAAYTPLPAYRAAGADAVALMGAHVSISAASDLVGAVYCNNMTPMFDPDPVFNDLGIDNGKSYLRKLMDARPGLIGMWIVGQNDNPGLNSASTNVRVAALRSLGSGIQVLVIHDQFSPNPASNLAQAKQYLADRHGFGYYPFAGSSKYGGESTLPMDAQTAQQLDGGNATGIVQEFNWYRSDPVFTQKMGFSNANLTEADVARMATSLLSNGDRSVLLLTLKPEGDDANFITNAIKAVKAANPTLGN